MLWVVLPLPEQALVYPLCPRGHTHSQGSIGQGNEGNARQP